MSVSLIQPHLATKDDGLFKAKFVTEVGKCRGAMDNKGVGPLVVDVVY